VINLLPLLQGKGLLDEKTSDEIFYESQETGRTIEEIVLEKGITEDNILAAKGEHWGIPVRSLSGSSIVYETLQYIPEESAKHYQVIPLAFVDDVLEVGIVDPDNIDALDALNFISTKQGVPFKVFLISEKDYQKGLAMYGGLTNEVGRGSRRVW
jgi:Type II secretion system (T2SS), protein E, N-terminal domain